VSHYTEEEQIAQFKDWWSRNGKPLLVGGVLAIAIVFGWQTWQKQQANRGELLSATYQQLLDAAFSPDGTNAGEMLKLLEELESISPEHAYAQYARLLVARVAVLENRLDDAAAMLQPVVDKPANAVLGELSHQRLARVLAASGKPDQALSLLDGKGLPAYSSARDELRGDVLVQLGRLDEARQSYRSAREGLDDSSAAGSLMMKLDDLSAKDA
jgi:predicted negative regulator of RcsB-dependent stress response